MDSCLACHTAVSHLHSFASGNKLHIRRESWKHTNWRLLEVYTKISWCFGDPNSTVYCCFLWALRVLHRNNKNSNRPARLRRPIWVFAVCIWKCTGFVVPWLIIVFSFLSLRVLQRSGSLSSACVAWFCRPVSINFLKIVRTKSAPKYGCRRPF